MKTSKTMRREMIDRINALRVAAGHAPLSDAKTTGRPLNHLRVWLHQAEQGIH